MSGVLVTVPSPDGFICQTHGIITVCRPLPHVPSLWEDLAAVTILGLFIWAVGFLCVVIERRKPRVIKRWVDATRPEAEVIPFIRLRSQDGHGQE
jgi:hypothetical protein